MPKKKVKIKEQEDTLAIEVVRDAEGNIVMDNTIATEVEPTLTEEVVEQVTAEVAEEEPVPDAPEPSPDSLVKVKVLTGTLRWEGGTFQKGEVFECTLERIQLFNPKNIEVLT